MFTKNRLQEGKFRSTNKLKTLMKAPIELKLSIFEKTKKASVRDIVNRSDLASDLLSFDKIILQ